MSKKRTEEVEPAIPPQDQRICVTICVCQMMMILSVVSIVYLTVAVYAPSINAIQSGVSEVPVMCTTIKTTNVSSCTWPSCGEWCLSKPSGACIQIQVHLRNNGSNMVFRNCTYTTNKICYGIDLENAFKVRCVREECKNLTGMFNCSLGNCINITDAFECNFQHTDPPLKCSGRRGKITCGNVTGLYTCMRGTCEKIRPPYNCERRCVDIPTRNKNVVVLSGDKIFLAQCISAINADTELEVWNEAAGNVMMASCLMVETTGRGVEATDCINGSVLDKRELGDLTNFTYLSHLHLSVAQHNTTISPLDTELTIRSVSNLTINLDGCVNTLQDECKEFFKNYGRDGSDHNARARFPCHYSEKNPDNAMVRFSLETTYRQFMLATLVPIVMMFVSCITLSFCQRTVRVGDDAKMRYTGCGSEELLKNEELDDDTLANFDGDISGPGEDASMRL